MNRSFSFPSSPRHESGGGGSADSNGTSTSISSKIQLKDLTKRISSSTCFAFVDLVVTVLKLDFFKEDDDHSKAFCNSALELVLGWSGLPEKTAKTLWLHLKEDFFTEDIASLITAIRSDVHLREMAVEGGCENPSIYLIESVFVDIIRCGSYDCRYRVLLRHVSALIGVLWDEFEQFEDAMSDHLVSMFSESEESLLARAKLKKTRNYKRLAMIGAATGLGGVLVGLTGGLAAPLVASGIATLTASTALGGLIASTGGTVAFGTIFGAAGASLSGYRMNKRIGATEEFVVERLTEDYLSSLHCVLCVSGFIGENNESAFRLPWRHLWHSREQHTLRWEGQYLEELGKAIEYFVSFAVSVAIQRSLMETVLAGLVSAVAWPVALLGSSCVIDNPWNVCTSRAKEVGEHLADLLLTRQHGSRPITLIGYSLGARVIYHCLMEMQKRNSAGAIGIVEDVVLLGAPVTASSSQWRQICKIVGGRIINGFCRKDWLLRFLYRTMNAQISIAGTGPIDNRKERKIVNYDLSHIVKGHMDYAKKLTAVLEAVGIRVTPMSQASYTDLQILELEQSKIVGAELDKNGNTICETTVAGEEDNLASSLTVERCRSLTIVAGRNEGNDGGECDTDPLGSLAPRSKSKCITSASM